MKLTPGHIAVLIGIISSISLQLSGLPNWDSANTPSFWAGLLGHVATALGAVFVQKPDTGVRNRRATDPRIKPLPVVAPKGID